MAFSNDKAIYLQIADRLSDEILAETYKAFDRIPSVREYAARLGVNANTEVKAYARRFPEERAARDGKTNETARHKLRRHKRGV